MLMFSLSLLLQTCFFSFWISWHFIISRSPASYLFKTRKTKYSTKYKEMKWFLFIYFFFFLLFATTHNLAVDVEMWSDGISLGAVCCLHILYTRCELAFDGFTKHQKSSPASVSWRLKMSRSFLFLAASLRIGLLMFSGTWMISIQKTV